jgi:hypothetical protein
MNEDKEASSDLDTRELGDASEIKSAVRPREKPKAFVKRAGFGTWLFGVSCGVVVVFGAFAFMAHEQGSYRAAGSTVDRKLANAERSTGLAAQRAGDAAKEAGDSAATATQRR